MQNRGAAVNVIGETQACVIGAGVMGLFTAFEIAGRGHDVLVIDRGLPGQEASAANAGTLAIQNKHTAAIPATIKAIGTWRTLRDETGIDIEYERRGGFRIAETRDDVGALERAVAAQRAHGLAVEMVYQPRLAREAPYLAPHVAAASFCAEDGMANPLASVRALLAGCARRRVTIKARTPVTAITPVGDREFLVHTSGGVIRAAAVVCAAGAWNIDVARMVGAELPIATEVQQASTTDNGPAVFSHIVTHIRGNLTVKQSRTTGKILIGGAWHGTGDRLTGEKRVRRDTLLGNLAWAAHYLPAIARARLLRAWVGFEGRTPDKLLIAGSPGAAAGFFVVGCSSGGYTLSPYAGLLTAQHVLGDVGLSAGTELAGDVFDVKRLLNRTTPATGRSSAQPNISKTSSVPPANDCEPAGSDGPAGNARRREH